MELLRLEQGTDEWLQVRLDHFTASEAPIVMGDSPHMSRDELLTYKKTTIQEEVSAFTQRIYDKGHSLEEDARPIAERILLQDLYPVTGRLEVEGLPLLGSFDGLTMMQDIVFEHKQWNAEKARKMAETNEVLIEYAWQLEQLLLISNAEYALFVMSDGTEDNSLSIDYRCIPERRDALIAAWKQFAKDLETHEPKVYAPAPEGKTPDQLPALSISVVGEVTSSNLAIYQRTAMQFIESINTDLQTDQDFANAEKTIKFCDAAEKELELVKKQALSQTEDIATLFSTVDTLKEAMRSKRLDLDKLVKSKKKLLRETVVLNAREALMQHVSELNRTLNGVQLPVITADFNAAIKGKRTIKSLEESANDELARAKIAANEAHATVTANLEYLEAQASEHRMLFSDLQHIAIKPPEDFQAAVKLRLSEYNQRMEEERNAEAARQADEKVPAAEQEQEAPVSTASRNRGKIQPGSVNDDTASKSETADPREKDIVSFLYNELGLYGVQASAVARAIIAGRVPHVQIESMAKAS